MTSAAWQPNNAALKDITDKGRVSWVIAWHCCMFERIVCFRLESLRRICKLLRGSPKKLWLKRFFSIFFLFHRIEIDEDWRFGGNTPNWSCVKATKRKVEKSPWFPQFRAIFEVFVNEFPTAFIQIQLYLDSSKNAFFAPIKASVHIKTIYHQTVTDDNEQ